MVLAQCVTSLGIEIALFDSTDETGLQAVNVHTHYSRIKTDNSTTVHESGAHFQQLGCLQLTCAHDRVVNKVLLLRFLYEAIQASKSTDWQDQDNAFMSIC